MKKGFTLVELLVVVSIIALLASIVVVSMGGARRSGRDTRAISDIKQIQTAIELTYDFSVDEYANLPEFWTKIEGSTGAGLTEIKKSLDPIPEGTGKNFYYWCDGSSAASAEATDTNKYGLAVFLESGKAGDLSGDCFYITEKGAKTGTTCGFTGASVLCATQN